MRVRQPGAGRKALVEKDTIPPGIDPEHHKVRSCSVVLPPDQAFKDAAREALTARPGVASGRRSGAAHGSSCSVGSAWSWASC